MSSNYQNEAGYCLKELTTAAQPAKENLGLEEDSRKGFAFFDFGGLSSPRESRSNMLLWRAAANGGQGLENCTARPSDRFVGRRERWEVTQQ